MLSTSAGKFYLHIFLGIRPLKSNTVDARYLEHLLSRTFWPVS